MEVKLCVCGAKNATLFLNIMLFAVHRFFVCIFKHVYVQLC